MGFWVEPYFKESIYYFICWRKVVGVSEKEREVSLENKNNSIGALEHIQNVMEDTKSVTDEAKAMLGEHFGENSQNYDEIVRHIDALQAKNEALARKMMLDILKDLNEGK